MRQKWPFHWILVGAGALLLLGCPNPVANEEEQQPAAAQELEDEIAAEVTVTIAFDGNGATGGLPPESISTQSGSAVEIPGNRTLVRSASLTAQTETQSDQTASPIAYDFGGWNTAADGSGESHQAGDTIVVESDLTLYAIWILNSPEEPEEEQPENTATDSDTNTDLDTEEQNPDGDTANSGDTAPPQPGPTPPPPVVEETPPAVDENPSVGEEDPPVVEETPPVVDENPPVGEETPPVAEEDPPVVEENPPVVEETPPVVDETPPVVEEDPPVVEVPPEVLTISGNQINALDWFLDPPTFEVQYRMAEDAEMSWEIPGLNEGSDYEIDNSQPDSWFYQSYRVTRLVVNDRQVLRNSAFYDAGADVYNVPVTFRITESDETVTEWTRTFTVVENRAPNVAEFASPSLTVTFTRDSSSSLRINLYAWDYETRGEDLTVEVVSSSVNARIFTGTGYVGSSTIPHIEHIANGSIAPVQASRRELILVPAVFDSVTTTLSITVTDTNGVSTTVHRTIIIN